MSETLDAVDAKILDLIQHDAGLSVAEIADRVGLSSSPCWRRIKRLEDAGVIQRRVNPAPRPLISPPPAPLRAPVATPNPVGQ